MKQYMKTRKKIRIENYDYTSPGIYFVTLCSCNREKIFCDIDEDIINVSFFDDNFDKYIKYTNIGIIVSEGLKNINTIYDNVKLLQYVIMPNHIHMLIEIDDSEDKISLSKIIGSYKRHISKIVNKNRLFSKDSIWQKSFYEHIIRKDKELKEIMKYIKENPLKWKFDEYYK